MIYHRNTGVGINPVNGELPKNIINREATREELESFPDWQLKDYLENRGLVPDYRVTKKMMVDVLMVIN